MIGVHRRGLLLLLLLLEGRILKIAEYSMAGSSVSGGSAWKEGEGARRGRRWGGSTDSVERQ